MEHDEIVGRLRGLNVLVLHPRDGDAEELLQQLNRIGCRAQAIWPPPRNISDKADLAFIQVSEKPHDGINNYLMLTDGRPTLIGMAGYESPSVLQNLIDLQVDSVLPKPVRPYGVLSSIVVARRNWQQSKRHEKLIAKLKNKVENSHKMNEAKIILMQIHDLSEDQAYKSIRHQAMASRKTIAEVVQLIIESNALLNNFVTKNNLDGGGIED
ncbi:Two component response regulator [Marinobacter salarius]|uniref:ANTAR domain-containing response regulator n=1 Tax=Marinobacter salarius TaxID=1420917 RepID=UPI0012575B4B|nr:ANTAR domain-containing protein [Marinobacter salarius]VVT14578.1 Regulator [Marinobacter salarius]VXB34338.1 Two component response regulator [Marinobacter salarius]